MTAINGIKSKERVQEHGEVFTPDSIVNDMLDLVDEQFKKDNEELSDIDFAHKYIENTVLEPACGDGQFLIRILYRKLEQVKKLPVEERELAVVRAVCSIYAVDIQQDNVEESRERMYALFMGDEVLTFDNKEHTLADGKLSKTFPISIKVFDNEPSEKLRKAVDFILKANIVLGNSLIDNANSAYTENTPPEARPVFFNDWHFNGDKIKSTFEYIHGPLPLGLEPESKEVDFLDVADIWGGYTNPIEKANDSNNNTEASEDEEWDF